MAPKTKVSKNVEIAVGLNKGHKVTKYQPKRQRPSRVSRTNRHAKFVRDVIREVSGLQPYEKRAVELLKIGKDKRTLKFLKRRLGTHTRSKQKRDEMQSYLAASRKLNK